MGGDQQQGIPVPELGREVTFQERFNSHRFPAPTVIVVFAVVCFSLARVPAAEPGSHWSFVVPRRQTPPAVQDGAWPRNAIDRFVLRRIEEAGLRPAGEADRRTLIRRLSLDLLGLPPTIGEVDAFLADRRPGAYHRLVDRLLDSPRFGERLALQWMDAARYADTHGYHEDYNRDMWPWRDWVIAALNDNMPFDQFTIEQLAGDLLPGATSRQVVATGFNRNHGVTASGISEEYRVEYVLDRVRTTATTWMGLTIGCAQCHEHKYDPVSQEEFYSFFANFNSVTDKGVENRPGNVDPLVEVVPLGQQAIETRLAGVIKSLEARRARRFEGVGDRVAAWERALAKQPGRRGVVEGPLLVHCRLDERDGQPVSTGSPGKPATVQGQAKWVKARVAGGLELDGRSSLVLGDVAGFERTDAFSYGAWVNPSSGGAIVARMDDAADYRGWDVFVSGRRVEVHLIHQWPGNAVHLISKASLPSDRLTHVFVTYDGSSRSAGVALYFDGKRQEVNVTRDRLTGSIRTARPLHIGRRNPSGFLKGTIDDVRIYPRQLKPEEVAVLAGTDGLDEILAVAAEKRTRSQRETLQRTYLALHDQEYRRLSEQRDRRRRELDALKKNRPTVMVMQDLKMPRRSFVLLRGQYDQHGAEVKPGVPGFLPGLPAGAPANRLGLARWLVDPSHPLTARVAVNRLWQLSFGSGLVETAEDFGTQGQPPSHPRLLDWLATEYIRRGWDTKSLLRLIVTSATYRQSSRSTPALRERDPANRLLARATRYRLPAELIRDHALASGGLLVEQIGGPSVRPYQPAGLWKETSNRGYVQDHGVALYRRSFYTYWKRSVPPPNMFALDAPTRETCTVRRQRTNTPLMALVLLNDPTFVEAARSLAGLVLGEKKAGIDGRIQHLFQRVTARVPEQEELSELQRLLADQLARYRRDPAAAGALLKVGESARDQRLDPAEHAAWTVLASVVLNLDEAITRE